MTASALPAPFRGRAVDQGDHMHRLTTTTRRSFVAGAGALALGAAAVPASAAERDSAADRSGSAYRTVRFMTYNASLNRSAEGQLVRDLSTPDSAQARAVAEVIQMNAPDVLLINEFDYDPQHRAAELFRRNYLERSQNGHAPIAYPHVFTAPVNTGVDSGLDLNADGRRGTGDDAWGFGLFPGQYGMLVLSRLPLQAPAVRTFQQLRWAEMPDSLLPWGYYGRGIGEQLRLSSKSHWDIPVSTGRDTIHLLASHPTPPSFDGPEDRNGRRNHDEIRFWSDYIAGPRLAGWIRDDAGVRGGLRPGSRFVIMGDMNSDPHDGDSWPGAIQQLLEHPRIQDPLPSSEGAVAAAASQGEANARHRGEHRFDTADFSDGAPGNLRVDYVLPSRNLLVRGSGVFWPAPGQPGAQLTGAHPFPTSDHRPVWTDLLVR